MSQPPDNVMLLSLENGVQAIEISLLEFIAPLLDGTEISKVEAKLTVGFKGGVERVVRIKAHLVDVRGSD